MRLSLLSKTLIQGALPGVLIFVLAFPADIFSQAAERDHIVSSQNLQQRLEASSAARRQEINTLDGFLSSPAATRAMKDARIDPAQVRTAIPTLSDQELATLSARAANAQQRFSAGSMSNDQLLIIILIIALVIVVVALH